MGIRKNKIIAIDGPAGSGKGTLAKALAEKFNLNKNEFMYKIKSELSPNLGTK